MIEDSAAVYDYLDGGPRRVIYGENICRACWKFFRPAARQGRGAGRKNLAVGIIPQNR